MFIGTVAHRLSSYVPGSANCQTTSNENYEPRRGLGDCAPAAVSNWEGGKPQGLNNAPFKCENRPAGNHPRPFSIDFTKHLTKTSLSSLLKLSLQAKESSTVSLAYGLPSQEVSDIYGCVLLAREIMNVPVNRSLILSS